ncbi:MAG: hypothetical protein HUJ95_03415, partial [Bacteroidales bacterium]|nr:hypothetical protein [Bacteroidales bacterium]
MKTKALIVALFAALLFMATPQVAFGQFRESAFKQNYATDKEASKDTTDYNKLSFKNLFRGLAGKSDLSIGNMFMGNLFMPGSAQIYNKQGWKLGIFYPLFAGSLGTGIYFNVKGRRDISPYLFAAAGVTYWAMQFDGVVNYKRDLGVFPGRATVYAILLPGLGQAVNGEFWKIPIYHGIIITSLSLFLTNNNNYQRYRRIYIESTQPGYSGPISGETALYYRNTYRRLRDYCILGMVAGYLLQIIDANVFSYMGGFEMSDDISMHIAPSLIPTAAPIN